MPAMTRPKTVYLASRCGCGECAMKYWLPPVSGHGSSAMPTVPRRYGRWFNSSRIEYPGPPSPSPRGSPSCITKSGTTRWTLRPLK